MMSRRYLWIAFILAIFVSCSKTEEPVVEPNTGVEPEEVVEPEDPWLFKDDSPSSLPATGAPLTISADFGGTRSHIEMNETETSAAVVWDNGDSFEMIGIPASSTNSYSYADFTTNASGVSVDFSTDNSLSCPPPFYAVYPKHTKFNIASRLVGIHIPPKQTAVEHGFAQGLAISYTTTQSLTDYLHFESQVSFVRFRMSGTLVSQIKQVTIKGTSSLAGDAILVIGEDGKATFTQDRSFNGDVHSSTVTLSGDFVAGTDYYIVLAPSTQSAFQMIFSDGQGHSTTLIASQITFPRGRISDFGTIDVGSEFTDENVSYEPILYMTASAEAPKPVTVAVIPDGFTNEEMNTYEMLAKSGIDALMNTEPYKTYRNYFNVWILKVASKDSGASITDGNGTVTTLKNTAFGSRWGETVYSDMAANGDDVYQFVEENCPDIINNIHPMTEVPVLMIINDARYGGICHYSSDGKGYGMVPYAKSGGACSWSFPSKMAKTDEPLPSSVTNEGLRDYYQETPESIYDAIGRNTGDWRNTLVHEFGGHCFGRLADEYWSDQYLSYQSGPINGQNWQVPFGMNLASDPDPNAVTWKSDVLDYPLETLVARHPNYGRIGIFQGGGTKMFGRWRSEMISCMIDNRYYFSTWQRMLIVKRIMSLSGSTFDAASFWAHDVTTDPVRDEGSSQVMGSHPLPVQEMPLLPPPVLDDF